MSFRAIAQNRWQRLQPLAGGRLSKTPAQMLHTELPTPQLGHAPCLAASPSVHCSMLGTGGAGRVCVGLVQHARHHCLLHGFIAHASRITQFGGQPRPPRLDRRRQHRHHAGKAVQTLPMAAPLDRLAEGASAPFVHSNPPQPYIPAFTQLYVRVVTPTVRFSP